ncbi:MAG: SUMF1/EgtB/PvdO family nonheme iron enzyme [Candidatus Parabeggiatoa sp.]|nr:SUMF1/EgtB/PvdO family nonheme iron enzyme [Candidatus Parabeggiatoa sp.]
MQKLLLSLLLLSLAQSAKADAELSFNSLNPLYYVGEYIIIDLQENLQQPSRFDRVDLWVAVELPSGDWLFKTPLGFAPFDPKPQAFRTSLDTAEKTHRIFDSEVIPGLGGDYVFYALYVEAGKNPLTAGIPTYRSNIATVATTLSNKSETPLPAPNPFSATPGEHQITLTWQPITGAASYSVYWQTPDGTTQNVSVKATAYVHTGLQNDINYTYWITAVSPTGLESSPSTTIAAMPQFPRGKVFQDTLADGSLGPKMVVIPAGTFRMGDIQGGGDSDEQPVHEVSVARFAMGEYELTVGEFRLFVEATGYQTEAEKGDGCFVNLDNDRYFEKVKEANWRNPYFSQTDNQPVTCISWNDATAYAAWLTQQTGQQYRLPTEGEWEYAARAGTETKYWWGNEASHDYANYGTDVCCSGVAAGQDQWIYTSPVGSFAPNAFGLYDTAGNLWEWTCSEYESRYQGKETQCLEQAHSDNDSLFVLRGGSWGGGALWVRSAVRGRNRRTYRNWFCGARLARIL